MPECSGGGTAPERGDHYPLRIIGPSNTDMLASAGEELQRSPVDTQSKLGCGYTQLTQAQFLSPFATAADVIPPAQLSMVRTVLTDDRAINTLSDELANRGVNVCHDTVAVIGEWDSLYARSLAEELTKAFETKIKRAALRDKPCKLNFVRYSYLRGLDGVTVGKKSTQDDGAERSYGSGKDAQAKSIEWPEGRDQRDYLRRLATRILDEAVRDRRRVAAIGVFGSDVYDKLLVLQALRPTLPNTLFFTTDLDARLFHPRTFDWTRNLLVASSFDLALDQKLQGDVPPFRDMYQTAGFLATQLALYDACASRNGRFAKWLSKGDEDCAAKLSQATITDWLGEPRLYELGRGTPVSLTETEGAGRFVHEPQRSLAPPAALGAAHGWRDASDEPLDGTDVPVHRIDHGTHGQHVPVLADHARDTGSFSARPLAGRVADSLTKL